MGCVAGFSGEFDAAVGFGWVNVDGEADAHIKSGVGFAQIDWAFLHDEVKDGWRGGDVFDLVDEWLFETHEFAPAVAGDVGGVVKMEAGLLAGGYEADVDYRGIEECFAIGAAIAGGSEISLWQFIGEGAAECKAVGVNAGGGKENDRVAVADVADDAVGF